MSFGFFGNDIPGIKGFLYRTIGWPNFIRRTQAKILFKYMNLNSEFSVLDMGCGDGQFAYEMSKYAGSVVGVDIRKSSSWDQMVRHRKNLSFEENLRIPTHLTNEAFDRILLSSVLQVVDDDKALLDECRRLLRKDGELILSVPEEYILISRLYRFRKFVQKILRLPPTLPEFKSEIGMRFNVRGKQYYSKNALQALLEDAKFKIIESKHSPGLIGSIIFEFLLLIRFHRTRTSLTNRLDILFLPLTWLDLFTPNITGSEVVVRVRKQ